MKEQVIGTDTCPCRGYTVDFVSVSKHGTFLHSRHKPARLARFLPGRIISNRRSKTAVLVEFVCIPCGRVGWRKLKALSNKTWKELHG